MCSQEDKYTYDTAEEFKKIRKELDNMLFKCEGKLLNKPALDLKPANAEISMA